MTLEALCVPSLVCHPHIYSSIFPSICPSTHVFTHPYRHTLNYLAIRSIPPNTHPSIHPFIYVCIHPAVYTSIHLYTRHPYVHALHQWPWVWDVDAEIQRGPSQLLFGNLVEKTNGELTAGPPTPSSSGARMFSSEPQVPYQSPSPDLTTYPLPWPGDPQFIPGRGERGGCPVDGTAKRAGDKNHS